MYKLMSGRFHTWNITGPGERAQEFRESRIMFSPHSFIVLMHTILKHQAPMAVSLKEPPQITDPSNCAVAYLNAFCTS